MSYPLTFQETNNNHLIHKTMKTNWIETYGKPEQVKKFQAGGTMPAGQDPSQGGAPAGPSGPGASDPTQGGAPQGGDIESMIAEYAQTRDPQLAVAICDQIVQMMAQGGQGGIPGGAAGPGAGAPPAGGPGGPAPAGRNGMKFKRGPVFTK